MQRPVNVKSRPRLPIPSINIDDDDDPYSIAGNNCISNENSDSSGYSGSSNSNGEITFYTYILPIFLVEERISSFLFLVYVSTN